MGFNRWTVYRISQALPNSFTHPGNICFPLSIEKCLLIVSMLVKLVLFLWRNRRCIAVLYWKLSGDPCNRPIYVRNNNEPDKSRASRLDGSDSCFTPDAKTGYTYSGSLFLNESLSLKRIAFYICHSDDVVLGLTTSGVVKVWTVGAQDLNNSGEPVLEHESKQIRCLNATSMTCCLYNQRTVIIVSPKTWQVKIDYSGEGKFVNVMPSVSIFNKHLYYHYRVKFVYAHKIYDAGDFSLLCSMSSKQGESWVGGDFLATDRIIVWNTIGTAFVYRLPTK